MAVNTTQLRETRRIGVSRSQSKRITGYAFILPAFLLYAFFFIYPFVISIYYSFIKWAGAGPKQYVGFANYTRLFFDRLLGQAL